MISSSKTLLILLQFELIYVVSFLIDYTFIEIVNK